MKIRDYYTISSAALTLVLAILGVIVFRALGIQQDLARSEAHRFRSFLLGLELFQSSEDLTRMARRYVATANQVYEKYYFQILDIRSGASPRPVKYTATYWHLSGVGKGPAVAMGEAVSLQDLMRREGITDQELALLQESLRKSNNLVGMEKKAFAAMKGLYEDDSGNFTIKKAPDQNYAIRLLYSDAYLNEKAEIMAPIQQFMDSLDTRTKTELSAFESDLRVFIVLALVIILLALLVVAVSVIYSFRRILRPIEYLHKQVDAIDAGDYAARCTVTSANEIGDLCKSFNSMADSLEKDIQRRKEAAEILKKNEGQVRLLIDSAGEAMYGVDLEGNCTFANPACARILGYGGPEALLGKNMHQLIHHSYPDGRSMPVQECRIYRAFRERREVHVEDEVLWRRDGTSFMTEYWSHPIWADNQVYGAVVTFNDITERKKAEEALAQDRQRLANVLAGTNVGAWESNIQNGDVVINGRMAEIMGYTLEELAPATIGVREKIIHPDDLKVSVQLLEKLFRKEMQFYECEVRVRHKNGNWVWGLEKGYVTKWTEDGKPLLMSGTLEDITERKQQQEKILYLATHDALTDLPNLRMARDRLLMALGRARRAAAAVAVLFVDLDGFKKVNDSLGHDAGDEVLKEAARRLRSGVREIDTVARIGGDEFLLVLTDLQSGNNAAAVARKLIDLLSHPFPLGRGQASIGASIGIALFPGDSDDPDHLVNLADEAMYRVKKAGKNGYAFVCAPDPSLKA